MEKLLWTPIAHIKSLQIYVFIIVINEPVKKDRKFLNLFLCIFYTVMAKILSVAVSSAHLY